MFVTCCSAFYIDVLIDVCHFLQVRCFAGNAVSSSEEDGDHHESPDKHPLAHQLPRRIRSCGTAGRKPLPGTSHTKIKASKSHHTHKSTTGSVRDDSAHTKICASCFRDVPISKFFVYNGRMVDSCISCEANLALGIEDNAPRSSDAALAVTALPSAALPEASNI